MTRAARFALWGGAVLIPLLLGLVHAASRGPRYRFGSQNSLLAYVLYGLVFVTVAATAGLPNDVRSNAQAFVLAAFAALASAAFIALAQTIRPGLLPRFVIIVAPLALTAWAWMWSAIFRRLHVDGRSADRVVAVLDGDDAAAMAADLASDGGAAERPFELAEVLNPADLSGPTSLTQRIVAARATVVVLSETAQRTPAIVREAAELHANGIRVRSPEGFFDEWLCKLPVSSLDRMALLTDVGEIHGGPYANVKRLMDLLFGFALAAAALVTLPFVLLGNLIANRGALLFRQRRVGRNGQEFTVVKFRTMSASGSDEASEWTRPDDPRITPFGRVLRRTHVDELPQFWNILRGDLSLVGPRPEQPHYVAELSDKLPFYDLRHAVQPGLTGWAQVKYRYASTEADALEKLQYDLYYVRHQSIALDFRIVGRTFRRVVRARGR